jgi:hypothetical protein
MSVTTRVPGCKLASVELIEGLERVGRDQVLVDDDVGALEGLGAFQPAAEGARVRDRLVR